MDTIYALSSGVGRAALAVVRISGGVAAATVTALCGGLPPPREATLRTLRRPADGAAIDKGLVLWFPQPASYTGEDLCEFHVHGSRAVVEALFATLRGLGLRAADPGEFSRRAFANGKLDLTELEGIADLVAAETEMQRRQALDQTGGALRLRCEGWRETLLDLRAEIEAQLDFSDEGDVPTALGEPFWTSLSALKVDMRSALASSADGERLRDGFRVAILGRPNVGKSSLLNALAKRDVAIVTGEAGTTRDIVEVTLDLGGYPVRLFDTAGLRETDSAAERIGVDRAVEAARNADLVIWLEDASPQDVVGGPPEGLSALWSVRSKADLGEPTDAAMAVSSKTGAGIRELLVALQSAAAGSLSSGSAILTRERHACALSDAMTALSEIADQDAEVVADLLRSASESIGRITGRFGAEDVLDRLFGEFCIGK